MKKDDRLQRSLRRICVFCGSSMGNREEYRRSAEQLARILVREQLDLVYGGGGVGLMGVLADETLSLGGKVYGVLTEALLTREVGHAGLTELQIVPTMHERKFRMSELADGFIALPGGFGTFEELFEVITWAQLGLHSKPVGLLNVSGYFQPLIDLLDHAVSEGFIPLTHRDLLLTASEPHDLVQLLMHSAPQPALDKWVD
jgi:uncharacterized protein (TIGR00730 family)